MRNSEYSARTDRHCAVSTAYAARRKGPLRISSSCFVRAGVRAAQRHTETADVFRFPIGSTSSPRNRCAAAVDVLRLRSGGFIVLPVHFFPPALSALEFTRKRRPYQAVALKGVRRGSGVPFVPEPDNTWHLAAQADLPLG